MRFLPAFFLLRFLLNRALSPLISDIVQLLLFVRRGVSPQGTRPTRMFGEESAFVDYERVGLVVGTSSIRSEGKFQ